MFPTLENQVILTFFVLNSHVEEDAKLETFPIIVPQLKNRFTNLVIQFSPTKRPTFGVKQLKGNASLFLFQAKTRAFKRRVVIKNLFINDLYIPDRSIFVWDWTSVGTYTCVF